MVGNEYAAQLLVQKREELLGIEDHNRRSPLDSAFANNKHNMSAYLLKLTPSFKFCDDSVFNLHPILTAIYTKQYDLAGELLGESEESPLLMMPISRILMAITLTFPTDLDFMESFFYPSFNNVREKTILKGSLLFHSNIMNQCIDDTLQVMKICNNPCCSWIVKIFKMLLFPIATLYPVYQLICLLFLLLRLTFSMLYFLLWKVLVATMRPIMNIEKKKNEYREAMKILSLICDMIGTTKDSYRTSIIEAVRQGTYEVVDEILFRSPSAINCKDEEGHNIIQLEVINRSTKVYNLIRHLIEQTESFRTMTDTSMNNLVHLAGRLAPSFVLDRTTGAALQLQRELIWREEVEKLMLPLERIDKNTDEETPAMVFTKEHRDLMKQGEEWMKLTAESCSITAALIVTIVFAAAITVPGGSNQESGISVFKKESAFTIFAVFNAFSLFTAATSLLLFLSILTARFSEKDFLISLPRRLILGLFTLFLSTTAMIVAFGAILFLVFCDQRPWMLAPISVFACMPISVIVTIKVPLLVDLIRSTYIPIFGKQSYLESCKISEKNTLFTN
ncbi:uncharacterized protein LOC143594087 isoform X2 [Bidens hawaiensis]|uniref:uncharacterized protein LOC143594087 isoform X2 n=1 Tax=Bidens hawaiensis TaxID=980011 RepID=UPI00404B3205